MSAPGTVTEQHVEKRAQWALLGDEEPSQVLLLKVGDMAEPIVLQTYVDDEEAHATLAEFTGEFQRLQALERLLRATALSEPHRFLHLALDDADRAHQEGQANG